MQPLLYSTCSACWKRVGRNINYRRNVKNLQCPLLTRDRNYYVLEWQMVLVQQSILLDLLNLFIASLSYCFRLNTHRSLIAETPNSVFQRFGNSKLKFLHDCL